MGKIEGFKGRMFHELFPVEHELFFEAIQNNDKNYLMYYNNTLAKMLVLILGGKNGPNDY
jgi:hypothetical protein